VPDAGSATGRDACVPGYGPCQRNSDCCTFQCSLTLGHCVQFTIAFDPDAGNGPGNGNGECATMGQPCSLSTDCCSVYCSPQTHVCTVPACLADGFPCNGPIECCSGYCH
jgi:hypothetical protein